MAKTVLVVDDDVEEQALDRGECRDGPGGKTVGIDGDADDGGPGGQGEVGGSEPPKFLSTHPPRAERMRDLTAYSERVMPLYQQAKLR
mgnify:CR=1 FL=1